MRLVYFFLIIKDICYFAIITIWRDRGKKQREETERKRQIERARGERQMNMNMNMNSDMIMNILNIRAARL